MRRGESSLSSDLQESVSKMRAAGSEEVDNLIAHVEEFVDRVGDAADPEIARLRAKVDYAVDVARKSLAQGAEQVQRKAQEAMDAGDQYVHEAPWQAIGMAALAGSVVGFLVTRRWGAANNREIRRRHPRAGSSRESVIRPQRKRPGANVK
jgi:ElaB/YqjD/DUF883 family membrane-anchored ribosome-binding protein